MKKPDCAGFITRGGAMSLKGIGKAAVRVSGCIKPAPYEGSVSVLIVFF